MPSSIETSSNALNSTPLKTVKRKRSKASVKDQTKIPASNDSGQIDQKTKKKRRNKGPKNDEKSVKQSSNIHSDNDSDDDEKITSVGGKTSSISSDTGSENSEDDTTRKRTDIGSKKKSKSSLLPETVPTEIPSFKPPNGFYPHKFPVKDGPSLLLSESNLEGKEIWYITIPSALDISSIKNISKTALENGTPVTKIKGDEYGFCIDSSETRNYRLITPMAKENGYRVVSKSLCKLVNLQQVMKETNSLECTPEIAKSLNDRSRNERKKVQPKGLRMRFHPLGSFTEKIETISEDSVRM